ncbi:MAG: hypothetical protein EXS64_19550 [Candidatus Latescibacteria bacterium]|nr:hypothetical protein [Candidatus Latescibacterota bacterium]
MRSVIVPGHRVHGVEDQVRQHLPQLRLVARDHRHLPQIRLNLDRHPVRHRLVLPLGLGQRDRLLHQGVQMDRF